MTRAPLRPEDGRLARSRRSRDAIVEATLALIFEGRVPSSADIADRAGVTQRTLFNQFGDMDTLVGEVARRQTERMQGAAPTPDPGAPFSERIETFTGALAAVLDESMHIRWALLRSAHPTSVELVSGARTLFREYLAATFAPELDAVVAPRRAEVLDELEIAVDPMAWRMRRLVQGHSPEEAAVRVGDTICAILRDATRDTAAS